MDEMSLCNSKESLGAPRGCLWNQSPAIGLSCILFYAWHSLSLLLWEVITCLCCLEQIPESSTAFSLHYLPH